MLRRHQEAIYRQILLEQRSHERTLNEKGYALSFDEFSKEDECGIQRLGP
jgi:hypothetical protein